MFEIRDLALEDRAAALSLIEEFYASPGVLHPVPIAQYEAIYGEMCNGGSPRVGLGSSDLMHRNLDRRVEVLVTIAHPRHIEQIERLFVPFDAKGQPLDLRVARHVTAVNEFLAVMSRKKPQQAVVLTKVPSYNDMVKKGIGTYL